MSPRKIERTITVPRPLNDAPPFTCGRGYSPADDLAAERKRQNMRAWDYLIGATVAFGLVGLVYGLLLWASP